MNLYGFVGNDGVNQVDGLGLTVVTLPSGEMMSSGGSGRLSFREFAELASGNRHPGLINLSAGWADWPLPLDWEEDTSTPFICCAEDKRDEGKERLIASYVEAGPLLNKPAFLVGGPRRHRVKIPST